jgi:hypothetical protein
LDDEVGRKDLRDGGREDARRREGRAGKGREGGANQSFHRQEGKRVVFKVN